MDSHTFLIKRRACVCAVIAIMTLAMPVLANAQIGIVYDVSGVWGLFQKGRDLGDIERGQGIPAGSIARPRSERGKLVIHLYDDTIIVCEPFVMKQCEQPFVLWQRSSLVGRIFATVKALIPTPRAIWLPVLARPPLDERGELMESVIRFDGNNIDLAETFEHMKPGLYLIRLVPSQTVTPKEALERVAFQWKPDNNRKASIPNLTPGLYEIFVFDQREDPEPSLSALILVSDTVRFAKSSQRFAEAHRWSSSWRARAGPDAEHTFLRAYLYSLHKPIK